MSEGNKQAVKSWLMSFVCALFADLIYLVGALITSFCDFDDKGLNLVVLDCDTTKHDSNGKKTGRGQFGYTCTD